VFRWVAKLEHDFRIRAVVLPGIMEAVMVELEGDALGLGRIQGGINCEIATCI